MRVFTDDASTVRISDNSMRVYCAVTSPEDLKSLSSKNLRNVARLARKAEREGGSVERTTYAGDEAHATGLDIFVKVEEASWKGPQGSGTSLSCDPQALGFYRDALRHFAGAADADARVEILTIGDQPAAGIVALRSGSQWNMLKVGYDERFSPFGPGGILLKLFLEEMVEDPGVNEVSLVTAPPWAGRWHLQEEPTRDIAVFMPSLAGRARSLRHDLVKAARGARASLERSNDA
jgi:CelD/BcsL family acetyltransferase involved in cellulose biosynthesis